MRRATVLLKCASWCVLTLLDVNIHPNLLFAVANKPVMSA